jgi:hypothetical protein
MSGIAWHQWKITRKDPRQMKESSWSLHSPVFNLFTYGLDKDSFKVSKAFLGCNRKIAETMPI